MAKGFTLVELLVSLVVIGIGLLGMLLANTYIQKVSQTSYEQMVATQDAHRVMELIRRTAATGTFPNNVANAFPDGEAVDLSQLPGLGSLSGEQIIVTYGNQGGGGTGTDPTVQVTADANGAPVYSPAGTSTVFS